jgi:hypothetical protein
MQADMHPSSRIPRRHFLGTAAAAAAGGGLISQVKALQAAPPGTIRETKHFRCRLAPDGPYIDSQRDHKAFGFADGRVFLSEDNATTWGHSMAFPDAENITFSCILKNGNILFATREKLFLSRDQLKTYEQVIVQDRHGAEYRPHTPRNPDQPGWYFHPLDGVHTWDLDGQEILVWGNYCNVLGGPVPVNIYYSTDQGETVKIAYAFGRNPHFQEAGVEPESFLGDPDNPIICRHIHAVVFHPDERAFYACTGDIDRGHGSECHWLRGVYDPRSDRWDWQVLISVNSNSRFKSGGIHFVDGQLYWAADANGPKGEAGKHDRGIFRCDPKDLTDPKKHTLLFNAEFEIANMIIEDGVILAGYYAPASTYAMGIAISPDLGQTWAAYDLAEFGPRSPVRFHPKNRDGWFRVDLRKGWIERGEVLFIQPKA